jgi:uncharacterized protein YyaL (SSP411 family)
MPAFAELLTKIREYFDQHRSQLQQQNVSLQQALNGVAKTEMAASELLNEQLIAVGLSQLERQFDNQHGGFGGAPKFPQAPVLAFLQHLQVHAPAEYPAAGNMLSTTLNNIARSGLYDHLAGGFYRYTVDGDWSIPHFEKMLYDNGQLLSIYAGAAIEHETYAELILQTRNWLNAEMKSPDNGFYAALDADSEGEEGRYYVWQPGEVESLLGQQNYPLFAARFGLDQPANFENQAWHLKIFQDEAQLSQRFSLGGDEIKDSLANSIAKLAIARVGRIPPARDDKQLAAWNALLASGLARAGRATGDTAATGDAVTILDFIAGKLFVDGRLFASYSAGAPRFPAYLDDYAFCLEACLEVLATDWHARHLDLAIQLADSLLERFEDRDGGGFFFTTHDHEQLIQRPKSMHDDAVPNGNGIAALCLVRLGHLLGESRYLDTAENTLRAAWSEMQRAPAASCSLLSALHEWLNPGAQLVLIGEPEAVDKWRKSLPNWGVSVYAPGRDSQDLPGILSRYTNRGRVTAYLCRGQTCSPPVMELDELTRMLKTDTKNA